MHCRLGAAQCGAVLAAKPQTQCSAFLLTARESLRKRLVCPRQNNPSQWTNTLTYVVLSEGSWLWPLTSKGIREAIIGAASDSVAGLPPIAAIGVAPHALFRGRGGAGYLPPLRYRCALAVPVAIAYVIRIGRLRGVRSLRGSGGLGCLGCLRVGLGGPRVVSRAMAAEAPPSAPEGPKEAGWGPAGRGGAAGTARTLAPARGEVAREGHHTPPG